MAAREEKGIREPGNSGPADPPLRSGLSLRFETLLVGIADRFHRSLRSPVRQSLRSLRLCPALRLSGGRPRLPRRICPQVDDAAKGAARRWITWRCAPGLSEEDGPSAGPLRGPVGAVPDTAPVGRQASGAGTGAGPYIESPRTPGGTCTRCPTPASRETEEASS